MTDRVSKMDTKTLRTTLVLAHRSNAAAKKPGLLTAIEAAIRANFDLAGIPNKADLELIYAHFTDEFCADVLSEYRFLPGPGSIRDNGACTAICELCGKGDTGITGSREDKLRYEFFLCNAASRGGIWCGSTCIINHGLKVEGASTSEEAKKVLLAELGRHKADWAKARWRDEHKGHERLSTIGDDANTILKSLTKDDFFSLDMLGETELAWSVIHDTALFRQLQRFYRKTGYLSPSKTAGWETAKGLLLELENLAPLIKEARKFTDAEARVDFLLAEYKKKKETEK